MKQQILGCVITLLLFFCFSATSAQESINSSGGTAVGGGASVSYSVGQTVYNTVSGATGSVSQGVQQTYTISIGIAETEMQFSLVAYPNPTLSDLMLRVEDHKNENLIYMLYDMQGQLVESNAIPSTETQINTSVLSAGTYMLNILLGNKTIQSFKIIKN